MRKKMEKEKTEGEERKEQEGVKRKKRESNIPKG